MATVLVTGGTGDLGRHVIRHLVEAGHACRRLVHRSRPSQSAVRDLPGDLRTGAGLGPAVEGADTVIHCATSPLRPALVDVEGTGRLLQALGSGAPTAHLIYISIVGIDDHPYFYYRAKAETERLVMGSGNPWSIQRATQFHELLVRFLRPSDRLPVAIIPGGLRFQPMAASEAARRLVELVEGGPSGRMPDISGPETRTGADLARTYRQARGLSPRVVELPLAGRTAVAFRRGGHILAAPRYGRQTWEQFLATRS